MEQPGSVVAAVQDAERAKHEAVIADLQRQIQELLAQPPVVPEMVLTAEKVVGRPRKRWPDVRKVSKELGPQLY